MTFLLHWTGAMPTRIAAIALLALSFWGSKSSAAVLVNPHELDACLVSQGARDDARKMAVIADAKGWYDLSPEAVATELAKIVPPSKRAQLVDEAVQAVKKMRPNTAVSDEELHAMAVKAVDKKLYEEMKAKVDTLIPNAPLLKACGIPTGRLRLLRAPKRKA